MSLDSGVYAECQLEASDRFVQEMLRKSEESGESGEVVLVVPRPDGRILLHTKSFYPNGAYRLPTGKLHKGESPQDAFYREFREELGQEGEIERKLGALRCIIFSGNKSVDFTSHIYLAKETSEEPYPEDQEEQITGFITVKPDELGRVAENLRNLPGKWQDWGRFRALVHEFVAKMMA